MPQLQATQNSILAYEKRHPGTSTYHRSAVVELTGIISEPLLREAIRQVMLRHDMLRMKLKLGVNGSELFDLIPNESLPDKNNWPLQIIDATSHSDKPPEALYETLKAIGHNGFIEKPFDFYSEPMWRAGLVKLSDERHQVAFLFHHIIIDEPSIGIILQDISEYYNALLNKTEPDLLPLPSLDSVDITLPPDDEKQRLQHWQSTLKDLNAVRLQSDKQANQSFHFNGNRIPFKLDATLIGELGSTFPDYSVNSLFLATLYTLLHRYTGENDICIGITSANRRQDHVVTRQIMGRLVNAYFNSIPIRIKPSNETQNFSEILDRVHQSVQGGLKNQLPHDQIFQQGLDKKTRANLAVASLFNFLLVTNSVKPTLDLEGTASSRLIELDLGHSKFESFGINCDELPDRSFECFIEYNTDQFNLETMTNLVEHFQNILTYVARTPHALPDEIPILSTNEIECINEFNNTKMDPVYTGSVADLIHSVATSSADNQTALVFHHSDGKRDALSYAELEKTTNQLASYINNQLYGKAGSTDQPIAICFSRSLNLVTTILAALKIGRPFVILNTTNKQGVDDNINAAQPICIIADNTGFAICNHYKLPIVNLDDAYTAAKIAKTSGEFHSPSIEPSKVAYITQTSGSTGNPKMVQCTHEGLLNLLNSLMADQGHQAHTKILSTAPATFDSFFYDILVALATTGEIHLTHERGRLSPSTIESICKQENLDFATFTAEIVPLIDEKIPLKRIISMGNAANEAALKRWVMAGKHVENDCGFAEATIHTSTHISSLNDNPALIGKPIRNMKMLILDRQGNFCPVGVAGELYVAGPGLALSYLSNPELNHKKFKYAILDTSKQRYIFTDEPSKDTIRLYATGDACCYDRNNQDELEVKHIGRLDKIIKLHGMRIEINEVKKVIGGHPLVKSVVLLPNESKSALIAYILPTSQTTSLDDMRREIRNYLTTTGLSPAAYPRTIMTLTRIPLNANGKLDIQALPTPTEPKPRLVTQTTKSNLLATLLPIWLDVLGLDKNENIDLNKTFRELGGTSLLLATLETRLNNNLVLKYVLNLPSTVSIGIAQLPSSDMTLPEVEASLSEFSRPYKLNSAQRLTVLPPPQQPAIFPSKATSDKRLSNSHLHRSY